MIYTQFLPFDNLNDDLVEWRKGISKDYYTIISVIVYILGTDNLLNLVKMLKQIAGIGLKECKDMIESYLAAHASEAEDKRSEFEEIFRKKELLYAYKSDLLGKENGKD